jgi:hypothetical protein
VPSPTASPGNKAGGLTTLLEKSLGAVAKGGSSNLEAVYEYAEKVTAHGLTIVQHFVKGMQTYFGHDTAHMDTQLAIHGYPDGWRSPWRRKPRH